MGGIPEARERLGAILGRTLEGFRSGARRGYLLIAFSENAALVTLLAQSIILTRILGAEQLGIYSLALGHLTLVGQVACLGLPQSYTLHARRSPDQGQAYFNGTFLLLMGSSAVTAAATVWLVPLLSPELPRSMVTAAVLASYVPLIALRPLFRNALNIEGAYGRLAAIPVFASGTQLLLVAILAATGGLTVWTGLVVFIAATAVRTLAGLPRALGQLPTGGGRGSVYCDLIRTSPMYFFVTLTLLVYTQAPIVLLGALGGAPAELGYLSRALQVAGLAPLAVQGLMPLLFNHWAGRSDGAIQNNVRECALAAAALIVPVTVTALLFGREIMSLLFGAEFRPAYAALVVLQFMALPLVLMNLLTQAMGSRGTQHWTIAAYGGSGAVLVLVAGGAKVFLGEASALTVACGALAGSLVGASALIAALWRRTS